MKTENTTKLLPPCRAIPHISIYLVWRAKVNLPLNLGFGLGLAIHLHLQLQLNSLLRFLVMSTGILTAHQIADCHLIAAAIA